MLGGKKGYLFKRNVPISPPSMQKVYCILYGTLLLDYDNEEDAKTSMAPKLVSEILGTSEWDGQGRANQYPNSFLLVTHTGVTYYLSANSLEDRDDWILNIRRALECNFVNVEVVHFKPSKMILNKPPLSSNNKCGKTGTIILNMNSAIYCKSCGLAFSSIDFVNESTPLLQLGIEECETVCQECFKVQLCLLWLKTLIYNHTMTLHELTPDVLVNYSKFKSSFKLRCRVSSRLNMAAELLNQSRISPEEFEELRSIDNDYRRELLNEESDKLKGALNAIGNDMQTIISVLTNPVTTEKGGRKSYYAVIMKVLDVADKEPELIDFYWPQLLQAHLIEASSKKTDSLMRIDLLQQALLVISQKYPSLGIKLAWSLISSIGDYSEKKISQTVFAANVSLLLQLELIVTGVVSSISDVPTCQFLKQVLKAADHQQQELGIELSTLFIIRRRLQEMYDDEDLQLKTRIALITPDKIINNEIIDGDDIELPTCLSLLNKLGVGQREINSPSSSSSSPSSPLVPLLPVKVDVISSSDSNNNNNNSIDTIDNNENSFNNNNNNNNNNNWIGFGGQIDFFDKLTTIVDNLRFIERPLRTETLMTALHELNNSPDKLGWDPTSCAGEPCYRISRIIVEESRVFRTKARAPSLIIMEVIREDLDEDSLKQYQNHTFNSRVRTGTMSIGVEHDHNKELEDVDTFVNSGMSQTILDINKSIKEESKSNSDNITSIPRRNSTSSLLSSHRKSSSMKSMLGSSDKLDSIDTTNSRNSLKSNGYDINREIDLDLINMNSKVFESATKLLDAGKIDQNEYELLIKADNKFQNEVSIEEDVVTMNKVESAFGEPWIIKKERILEDRYESNCEDYTTFGKTNNEDIDNIDNGFWPSCDLRCFIIKSNDDLRQEICCMQLMTLCQEIFLHFGLGHQLWLKPYRIVSTGSSTGVVQVLPDTISLDGLKKTSNFTTLVAYFNSTYGSSKEKLLIAKTNFSKSIAAYSLFCYILQIKDRHNGNMLLDTAGHIIHIDFGFLLSIAPGGTFSLETAPFKLTEEMVDVLGGVESQLFGEFVKSFTAGFLALRANSENIIASLTALSINSPFPCFAGKDINSIIEKLRTRFRSELNVKDAVQHCLDLIISSYSHYGTSQYDSFQWYTNGITP
jgi:phosphatidylinositol 4-kinase